MVMFALSSLYQIFDLVKVLCHTNKTSSQRPYWGIFTIQLQSTSDRKIKNRFSHCFIFCIAKKPILSTRKSTYDIGRSKMGVDDGNCSYSLRNSGK